MPSSFFPFFLPACLRWFPFSLRATGPRRGYGEEPRLLRLGKTRRRERRKETEQRPRKKEGEVIQERGTEVGVSPNRASVSSSARLCRRRSDQEGGGGRGWRRTWQRLPPPFCPRRRHAVCLTPSVGMRKSQTTLCLLPPSSKVSLSSSPDVAHSHFFFEHLLFDDHRKTGQKGSMLLAEEFGEATLRKSLNDFSLQYDAGGLKSYPALFGAPLPAI